MTCGQLCSQIRMCEMWCHRQIMSLYGAGNDLYPAVFHDCVCSHTMREQLVPESDISQNSQYTVNIQTVKMSPLTRSARHRDGSRYYDSQSFKLTEEEIAGAPKIFQCLEEPCTHPDTLIMPCSVCGNKFRKPKTSDTSIKFCFVCGRLLCVSGGYTCLCGKYFYNQRGVVCGFWKCRRKFNYRVVYHQWARELFFDRQNKRFVNMHVSSDPDLYQGDGEAYDDGCIKCGESADMWGDECDGSRDHVPIREEDSIYDPVQYVRVERSVFTNSAGEVVSSNFLDVIDTYCGGLPKDPDYEVLNTPGLDLLSRHKDITQTEYYVWPISKWLRYQTRAHETTEEREYSEWNLRLRCVDDDR